MGGDREAGGSSGGIRVPCEVRHGKLQAVAFPKQLSH